MNAAAQPPTSHSRYDSKRPKRNLWKWALLAAVAWLLFLMLKCGSLLYSDSKLAGDAVRRFHAELNNGEYDQICREGDEVFSQGPRHNELLGFLDSIHQKLGNAETEKQTRIKVDSIFGGTLLTSQFNTQFSRGSAVETFTWRKKDGKLRLQEYPVRSGALSN